MRISTACSSANSRVRLLAVALALLLPAAALFSLCVGASGASLTQGLADLLRGVSSPAARIVRYIRLPRVLAAMLLGIERFVELGYPMLGWAGAFSLAGLVCCFEIGSRSKPAGRRKL